MLHQRSKEEILCDIVVCFTDRTVPGDGWTDTYDIAQAVWNVLEEEVNVLQTCDVCDSQFSAFVTDCPYYDDHQCAGGCGETNENCTCDNCEYCGCGECQCPRCKKCGVVQEECGCPEEEAVFA